MKLSAGLESMHRLTYNDDHPTAQPPTESEDAISTISTAPPPLVLALDIGTSSVRALLFDGRTRRVDDVEAREPFTVHARVDGTVETDADALLARIWRCIDTVLSQAGPYAGEISAVSTSTFVSNLMGIDQAGAPVTPLITYADTRPAGAVPRLRGLLDEQATYQRLGCRFHPSYQPARFLWMADAHPDWLTRSARWITLGEYMELALFGDIAGVSYSVASWSGLLNRHTLDWDEELLSVLPIDRTQLSPPVDVYAIRRGLSAPFAARWPVLRHAAWLPAVGDGATANLGSGCTVPDHVALTVGTTSAMRIVAPDPVAAVPDGLWSYRVDGRHALVGGAMTEGGNLFAWVREQFTLGVDDGPALESALAAIYPDSHGLTFLPLLGGERSPGWNAELRGAILGLQLATTAQEILRAGLEGIACRIALVYERLRPLLPPDVTVIASGGAVLSSPVWLQIMADALDAPVVVSNVEEASARGAALLALTAVGALPNFGSAPPALGQRYEPAADAVKAYAHVKQRQANLYAFMTQQ